MRLVFLRSGSPTLARAWSMLEASFGPEPRDPRGEVWQYMGSVVRDGEPDAEHQFRHRCLPSTGQRTCWSVRLPLSREDVPEVVGGRVKGRVRT